MRSSISILKKRHLLLLLHPVTSMAPCLLFISFRLSGYSVPSDSKRSLLDVQVKVKPKLSVMNFVLESFRFLDVVLAWRRPSFFEKKLFKCRLSTSDSKLSNFAHNSNLLDPKFHNCRLSAFQVKCTQIQYCDKEMEHKAVKKKRDTLVFVVL